MPYLRYKVERPSGVNFSLEPSQLDGPVWDNAFQVAFKHGMTKKASGYEQGFGPTGEAGDGSIYPQSILPLRDDSSEFYWWAYASTEGDGTGRIHRIVSKDAHTDVTPTAGIPAEPDFRWNGDSINGVPYFNRAKPYKWDGVSEFEAISTFPGHVKANLIRTYGSHMIALNFNTTNFTPDPNPQPGDPLYSAWAAGKHQSAVWWSDEVIGKNIEVSWADADPTKESGWNFLGGAGGPILDGKTLRESFIIYRERSIWQMSYVGGIIVFSFKELFDDVGILGQDCVAEIDGHHFVVGQSDIYMHNGVAKRSVADGVIRKEIFNSIDPEHIDKVFVAVRYQEKEAWVCIPEAGNNNSGRCNIAYVYNWEENHWSKRSMPDSICSAYTILSIAEDDITWEAESEGGPLNPDGSAQNPDTPGCTWEEAADTWRDSFWKYNSSQWGLVFGGETLTGGGAIFTSIKEPTNNGENFTASVEKKWMDMDNYAVTKTINKIWPLVRGGEVDIWVAGSETTSQAPTWRYVGRFNPDTRANLGCTATGKYLHVKMEIPDNSRAEIRGYELEYIPTGER